MNATVVAALLSASALLIGATAPTESAASWSQTQATLRGQTQELHRYSPTGKPAGRKVLFVPGVGGWRGWAITVAETMATWGFEVAGLDTKVYLDGFTRSSTLTEADIMNDFRELAASIANGPGDRVTFVGWSEGAGLGVLAAAAEPNKAVFDGLVVFGLGDENAIAWHSIDNLMSLVKKPNEPTFKASPYMPKIAPLPFFMIQSSHDQYTPMDEANRLFKLAREPKRFALVEGRNHRFDGNQDEFFRTLRDGLEWVTTKHENQAS